MDGPERDSEETHSERLRRVSDRERYMVLRETPRANPASPADPGAARRQRNAPRRPRRQPAPRGARRELPPGTQRPRPSLAGLEGRYQKRGAAVGPGPVRNTPWPQSLWRHLSPKFGDFGEGAGAGAGGWGPGWAMTSKAPELIYWADLRASNIFACAPL